jgi:hypothetical protein
MNDPTQYFTVAVAGNSAEDALDRALLVAARIERDARALARLFPSQRQTAEDMIRIARGISIQAAK